MFLKQKTAYEMRISDWSSDVCSSYLFSSFSSLVPPPTRDSLRSVPPSLFFISLFSTAGCQSGSALRLPINAQTVCADTESSAVEITLVIAIDTNYALYPLVGQYGQDAGRQRVGYLWIIQGVYDV